MISRYSRPEMRAIWTDENKIQIWLQIELLASEALVAEGIVPGTDFNRVKAGAEYFAAHPAELVERQKELEKLSTMMSSPSPRRSRKRSTTQPAAGSTSVSPAAILSIRRSPCRWSRARGSSLPTRRNCATSLHAGRGNTC